MNPKLVLIIRYSASFAELDKHPVLDADFRCSLDGSRRNGTRILFVFNLDEKRLLTFRVNRDRQHIANQTSNPSKARSSLKSRREERFRLYTAESCLNNPIQQSATV